MYFVGSPGDTDDGDSHSKDLYEGIARQLVEKVAARGDDREGLSHATVHVTQDRKERQTKWVRVEDARAMLTAIIEGLLEEPPHGSGSPLTLLAAKAWTRQAEGALKDWLLEWNMPSRFPGQKR